MDETSIDGRTYAPEQTDDGADVVGEILELLEEPQATRGKGRGARRARKAQRAQTPTETGTRPEDVTGGDAK